MSDKNSPTRLKTAFTLIELLVSITILSIILLALGSAMGFVTRLWLNGIGSVDNFTKARVMLNLLDRDIQMMVMRRDMAAFVDGSGNPACAFYTNVQGYNTTTDTRAVSLVQYVLTTTTNSSILQRNNYGMNFSNTSPVVGSNPTPTTFSQLTSISASGTETLATGVILFQYQFVDGAGNILTPPPSNPGTGYAFSYNYSVPAASSNPREVIISMLVLNNPAYNIATQSSTMIGTIQGLFPLSGSTALFGNNTPTYSQYWNSVLNPTVGTFGATLPLQVRSGLQVFERHIPLPLITTSS